MNVVGQYVRDFIKLLPIPLWKNIFFKNVIRRRPMRIIKVEFNKPTKEFSDVEKKQQKFVKLK